jgi:diguanylate cyclase (GGDEF)-like protein
LLMIDIDHFKSFNDVYGHLAGDQVLIAVARALQRDVRAGDHVARFGGEEFLVLLPNTATTEAVQIATRLRRNVKHTALSSHEGAPLPGITISIGLAEGLLGESTDSLLARADAALYQAKQEGRDRLIVSTPDSGRVAADARIGRLHREPTQD